jgi:hypothetical protein
MIPVGRKTGKEKKPFHIAINRRKDVNPQTGHIAIINEIIEIKPTTAPIGINLGLYYSIDCILNQYGRIKLV